MFNSRPPTVAPAKAKADIARAASFPVVVFDPGPNFQLLLNEINVPHLFTSNLLPLVRGQCRHIFFPLHALHFLQKFKENTKVKIEKNIYMSTLLQMQ